MPDHNEWLREAEKERKKQIKELKARSKPLRELIATAEFTVNEVLAESYATSFTPASEMRLGGRSPVYEGGLRSRLVLQVSPNDDPALVVRILKFDGISAVRAGDMISAKIPRYEEKTVNPVLPEDQYNEGNVFYLDRDFKPEESAIELAILSKDRTILRTERATGYLILQSKYPV